MAQYISAIEAARRMEVGLNYLYYMLWTGKIEGQKEKRQWRVSVASVDAYLRRVRNPNYKQVQETKQ